jgi:hypothetical protein
MKRKILIACIVILAFGLISPAFAGNELTLTYSQLKTARLLRVQLDAPFVSYCLQIRQSDDTGLFTLEAPPFFVANINDRIRIGEIQDSGIFSLMLSPMGSDSDLMGFGFGENFRRIVKPSIKPVLSGMALSFANLDLIALSPVFNPDSPYGFGAIGGTSHFFAGLLLATQNDRTIAQSTQHYQVNWRQLGVGRHMVFSIFGAGADAQLADSLCISGSIFMQNAWDILLGGGTTVGWNIDVDYTTLGFRSSRKLGGFGVKLKQKSALETPVDSFFFSILAKNPANSKLAMELEYNSDTYEIPVYGGESQRRVLSYSIGASYGDYSIKAVNTTNFDKDRGKVSRTVYQISASAFQSRITLEVPLYRPIGQQCYVADMKFTMITRHASLKMEGGKTYLEFNWEYDLDDCTVKFSIDQDRFVSASLKFVGI